MSVVKRSRIAHVLRAQICLVDEPPVSKEGSSPRTDELQDGRKQFSALHIGQLMWSTMFFIGLSYFLYS